MRRSPPLVTAPSKPIGVPLTPGMAVKALLWTGIGVGLILALFALTRPAAAQQAYKADAFLVTGTSIQIDSTAGTLAGSCQAVSGTFPKQTLIGGAGVDARTTTSEALADSDRCKLVTFSNASAVAATIAQAGSGGNFNSTWFVGLRNVGGGLVTLTATTSTINGASTLVLSTGQSVDLYSDGANYFTVDGRPSGHEEYTGSAPAVASGAGDCGTSPSIVGNDNAGRITVGSSTNGGKCTITFATGWTNAPICMVEDETTSVTMRPASPTQTTVAFTGAIVAADKLDYQCVGYH